jgi:mono/diheme cytochrome c family protein
MILVAGCASGSRLPQQQIASPGESVFNGYETEKANCYECHGGEAQGVGAYPDLGERVPNLSDEEIMKAVNEGPGMMPSFRDELTEEQKENVVAWLREKFGGPR